MKKTMKKVKQKAGRFVDSLLPSSRSQSPAPADRDLRVLSSTPLPPEEHAETVLQLGQTTVEPAAVQNSSQIVGASLPTPLNGGPIPPTLSFDRPGHADLQAVPAASETTSVAPDKVLEMARLASSSSPGPAAGLVSAPIDGCLVSC